MKAKITKVEFDQELQTKFGMMFKHKVWYDGKCADYLSKTKDQKKFITGQEAEFTETPREYNGTTYYNIKPVNPSGNSNFGRALKREQSKYSGFAMSYAKDLVVADKIKLSDMTAYTTKMFNLMVELDKTLES